jgi:3-hydroxy acid dehydrogenase / malonic semialdehyde reductase
MTTSNRTILVTGASRGIGKAISDRLLRESYHVIGISRTLDDSSHDNFTPVTIDLAQLDDLPEQLTKLRKNHPDIDAIVCNAGYGHFGSLEEFSSQQIRQLIDLNLTSQILLIREFLPHLKTKGRGDIIFMGSEAALSGGKKGVVYCATKFALRGTAQALRQECATSGVRVGIINPGMVDTDFFSQTWFRPGSEPDMHLVAEDVAEAAWTMLSARPGAAIDEINLSPQKRVIEFNDGG